MFDDLLSKLGVVRYVERFADEPINELSELATQVANCRECGLHQQRTQTVFGSGNQHASLMIIGEAPGFYEDKQGLPFVGKAGKLLDKMLKAIGLERQEVYITNLVKCRPEQNRDPNINEIASCSTYLRQQIALVNPSIILALGRYAAHYLLGSSASLAKLRNSKHVLEDNTAVVVSYHPAYLLRNPKDKAASYLDLLSIKHMMSLESN